jgi:hypothetical protein
MNRADNIYLHDTPSGAGPLELGTSHELKDDILPLAVRIQSVFRAAISRESGSRDSLWEGIEKSYHGDIFSCLNQEKPDTLVKHLSNIFDQGVLHGINQSGDQTGLIAEQPAPMPCTAWTVLSRLRKSWEV